MMPEPRLPNQRQSDTRQKIWVRKGRGGETSVHTQLVEHGDDPWREREIVFKGYDDGNCITLNDIDPAEWPGFNEETRDVLQKYHQQLQVAYEPYIPRQQIVRHPHQKDKWVLVQQNVHPVDPPILRRSSGNVSPRIRDQLNDLIVRMLPQLQARSSVAEQGWCLPDLNNLDNIVVTEDDHVYMLDTGPAGCRNQQEALTDKQLAQLYICPMALIELMSGHMPEKIMRRPEYRSLAELLFENYPKKISTMLYKQPDLFEREVRRIQGEFSFNTE